MNNGTGTEYPWGSEFWTPEDKKVTHFDFEQHMFSCWNVTQDINILFEGVMDKGLDSDQIGNALLGMHQIYELKFSKLLDMYEDLMSQRKI